MTVGIEAGILHPQGGRCLGWVLGASRTPVRVREEGKEQGGTQTAGISKHEHLGQGRSWCHLRGLTGSPLLTFVCRAGQCEPNCPSLWLPWVAASLPCSPPFLLLCCCPW